MMCRSYDTMRSQRSAVRGVIQNCINPSSISTRTRSLGRPAQKTRSGVPAFFMAASINPWAESTSGVHCTAVQVQAVHGRRLQLISPARSQRRARGFGPLRFGRAFIVRLDSTFCLTTSEAHSNCPRCPSQPPPKRGLREGRYYGFSLLTKLDIDPLSGVERAFSPPIGIQSHPAFELFVTGNIAVTSCRDHSIACYSAP